jgi:perosamine synthetase
MAVGALDVGHKSRVRWFDRHLALLGGTTTAADCLVALRHLIRPDTLIQGPSIAEYEQAFAARIGTRFAISFAAGRVGLYGILRALGIGRGDEVLLPAPTHIVVPNAIRYTGARPVYVDCEVETFNIDLIDAASRVSPRTRALILQHGFGIPVDLDLASELAERGLVLIEDCVHALGSTYRGRPLGAFGKAAFFSTEETKTTSTTMGGMVVTDDHELASSLRTFQSACSWPSRRLVARYLAKLLAYYGLTEPHVHRHARRLYEGLGQRHPLPRPTSSAELRGMKPAAYEQRLSNAQAAVGLEQLRTLDANLAHRRRIAERYRVRLSERGVAVPQPPNGSEPSFVRYPVLVENRAAAQHAVAAHAVLGTWFTSVLEEALSPAFGDYVDGSCPRAEMVARHLVNLPTHPRVEEDDADTIVNALLNSSATPVRAALDLS